MKWIIVSHFGITKRDIASRRIANLCNALDYQDQNVTLLTSDISCDSNELYELKSKLIKIPTRHMVFASKLKHFARDALDSSRVSRKEGASFRSKFTMLAKRFVKSSFADSFNTVSDSLVKDIFLQIDGKSYIKTIHGYIDNKEIVILLTSAGPAVMHEIGYKTKNKFPQIFWIADYRDQIIGNPVEKASLRMRRANFLAVENADMITAVSNGMADDIVRYSPAYKEVAAKTFTLYNGFLSETKKTFIVSSARTDVLRIAYTGVLYAMRRIDILIRALKKVNSSKSNLFELTYCGASASLCAKIIAEEHADSFITNKGFVSKEEAEIEQHKADILLLLRVSHKSNSMNDIHNLSQRTMV